MVSDSYWGELTRGGNVRSMQEQTTNLENEILDYMRQHDQADGYLKELVWNSVESRYSTYYSYARNVPELVMPHYTKISVWMADKSQYWRDKREQEKKEQEE